MAAQERSARDCRPRPLTLVLHERSTRPFFTKVLHEGSEPTWRTHGPNPSAEPKCRTCAPNAVSVKSAAAGSPSPVVLAPGGSFAAGLPGSSVDGISTAP